MKQKGYILWEGPSRLDGAPLVVIGTTKTTNRKTGPMAQVWILRSDIDPVQAVKQGLDRSICGACPLRGEGFSRRACYVNVGQAPLAIWRAFKSDRYSVGSLPPGTKVRLGAYGDPGAVPTRVIKQILKGALDWTGYTHLWRVRPSLAGLIQASVETLTEALEAWKKGFSTFRLTESEPIKLFGEIECASRRGISCSACMLCNGSKSVTIKAHGRGAKYVNGQ